ncbi:MAG: hypothetical protein WBN81_14000 [Gammaproteobacteria bacterium]
MLICKASTLSHSRFACCQVWVLLLLGLLIPAQAAEALEPASVVWAERSAIQDRKAIHS